MATRRKTTHRKTPRKKQEAKQPEPQRRSKVAMVGSASSSQAMTPWDDQDMDIWGLAWRQDLKRCDAYFEMHRLTQEYLSGKQVRGATYIEYLAHLPKPVYLVDAHPNIPNGVEYPLLDVIRYMESFDPGNANGDYFVSSIGFMTALALYKGYQEIHYYGVDLIDDDEYGHQRPNTEYMIGLARGMGRRVIIPDTSALCRFPYRYGYEQPPSFGPFSEKMLQDRVAQYRDKSEKAIATAHTADGARQEAEQMLSLIKHHSRGRQK